MNPVNSINNSSCFHFSPLQNVPSKLKHHPTYSPLLVAPRPPDRPPVSFVSSINRILVDLASLQSALSTQFRSDRATGVGLLEGAKTFSSNVNSALDTISKYEASSAAQMTLSRGSMPQMIGAHAQDYLMGRLSREALGQIASEAGLEFSSLAVSDIAERAFNYITSQSGLFAGSASASSSALSSTGSLSGLNSAGARALGAIGAAYSAYNVIQDWGKGSLVSGAINGATAGAYLGSVIPGVGTLVGGAIGGVVGAIGGLIKTGKHKDQIARDQVRSLMLEHGIIDKQWNLRLADGSTFDIGRDGRNTLQNLDGSSRAMYQVDFSNPLTAEVIGMANPLAAILTGGDEKLMTDFAGYFTNAALSNVDTPEAARENMLEIFKSFNIHPEQVFVTLQKLAEAGKLSEQDVLAMAGGFYSLLSPQTEVISGD